MIDPRLLPEGFLDAYRRALGVDPPEEFLEAYELLCDVLYFGARVAPEPGDEGTRGKRFHEGYWFGEPRVLGLKGAVDRRLAALRKALRFWAATRSRSRTSRTAPPHHRRRDLDRARGARDHAAREGQT